MGKTKKGKGTKIMGITDAFGFPIAVSTSSASPPEVKLFYTGLRSIILAPAQGADGELLAEFTVQSDDVAQTLTIKLKADGTFVSHEVK